MGPILGGILNDTFGFRYTCDIMGCCAFAFAVIYFFVTILPQLFSKTSNKKEGRKMSTEENLKTVSDQ